MKPLIGITGRRLPSGALSTIEDRYRNTQIDTYFSDFPRWVHAAGGIPVELPYEAGARETVTRLDGLLITGGQDVCPRRWGGKAETAIGAVDILRDEYEVTLAKAALDLHLPLLGICRGAQVVNVAQGGTLVADLPSRPIDHVATGLPVHTLQHEVLFAEGSLARKVYGRSARVNSLHHQAVDRCGEGVTVTGRAPDGTAEAIEVFGRPVLGVQWHPEWLGDLDPSFEWLVEAANDRLIGYREEAV